MRFLYDLHRAKQVFASLLLHKSPHEENTLRYLRLSRRREKATVDPDAMNQKLLGWKASFKRTIANKPGDAQKQ
jgi:hypothetical protein